MSQHSEPVFIFRHCFGFPRGYQLVGGVTAQQKQLGNAVCPPVAKVIAEAILELL